MANGHRGWSTVGLTVLAVAVFVTLAAFLRPPPEEGEGWTLRASGDGSGPQGVIARTHDLPAEERSTLDVERTSLLEGTYGATVHAPAILTFTAEQGGVHVTLTLRSEGTSYAADCWTDRGSATSPGVGPVWATASLGRCEFILQPSPLAPIDDIRWRATPSVEGPVRLVFGAKSG